MIQNKPQRPNVEVNKKKKNSAYINFLADRPKLASQCSHCLKVAKSDRNLSKRLYYCSATMIIQIYSFEWVLQLLIQLSFSHFFFFILFRNCKFLFLFWFDFPTTFFFLRKYFFCRCYWVKVAGDDNNKKKFEELF